MIPDQRCASLAVLGSLAIRSSIDLVLNIRAPAGWNIVFVGSCVSDSLPGAPLSNNNTFTDESNGAVMFMSDGLAHPGWR